MPKSFPIPILGLARQSVRTRLRLWSLSVLDFGLARFVPREGAADSTAYAHSAGPCYGCLLCCVVARSDAKPSCMLCCGVVGLWGCGVCVCVCFIGRVGPKKLQKSASFANFYQNRTKNGTKIDQKCDQSGPGGGEGATENQ